MSNGQPFVRSEQSLDDKFKRIDVVLDVMNKAIVAAWVLPEDELFLQTLMTSLLFPPIHM